MLYYAMFNDRINFIDENILVRGMNAISEFAAVLVRLRAGVEFILDLDHINISKVCRVS